jgi:urea transport system substrate-binding protein
MKQALFATGARGWRGATITAALLAAAFTSIGAQAADPIKIGVPVGLSGANSVVAPSVVQSAQLAVEEINAKGGILGRQVALEAAQPVHKKPSIR